MKFFSKICAPATRLYQQERQRLILWMPVPIGIGIALYFSLKNEPYPWLGMQLAFPLAALSRLMWRRRGFVAVFMCFLISLGFMAAQARTQELMGAVLEKELRFAYVAGTITEIQTTEKAAKLVLAALIIDGLEVEKTPRQVRVGLKARAEGLQIGDRVKMKATLYPLPRPAMPGAYDYARHLFFEGIGGVGYAVGEVEVVEPAAPRKFAEWLQALRLSMAEKMRQALGAEVGAVAAAMSVGEMSAIPEDVTEALRDSGLSHVLSISGLHLSLAAGILFFSIRFLLALNGTWAVYYPIKKIAAVLALFGAFWYLLLAGSPVPAERSFIMVAFVLVAVLLDRRGISLYSLSWAATATMLLAPDAMVGASFQMSFAATLAIVAFYERFGHVVYRSDASWRRKAWYALVGTALTSLVATLATAPFTIHHFNRFSLWGLLANVLSLPLTSFLIMPGVVLILIGMPIGVPEPGYWLAGLGIRGMIWVGETISALPYAYIAVPSLSGWGFALCVLGLLWLCLLRSRLRLVGALLVIVGVLSAGLYVPPDVFISDDGKQIAVKLEDGKLGLLKGSARAFDVEVWMRRGGFREAVAKKELEDSVTCESDICRIAHMPPFAVITGMKALEAVCAIEEEQIISAIYVRRKACMEGRVLVDRNDLEVKGAHVIYWDKNDLPRVEAGGDMQGRRPWSQ